MVKITTTKPITKTNSQLKPNKMNLTQEERQRLIDELNNQNELPKTYINSVEVISDNNNSVMTNGEWNLKANYTNK